MRVNDDIDLLVLDAHGVVFTSSFPLFLEKVANATCRSPAEFIADWRSKMRSLAWTGVLSEQEIWEYLVGSKNQSYWRNVMDYYCKIGPAVPHIPRWAEQVPIWILSNHRSEWLLPRIEQYELCKYFSRVIVSDQVGSAKPEIAAFQPILEFATDPARVLFVDDQVRNIQAAASLGLVTLQADKEDFWIRHVDKTLFG